MATCLDIITHAMRQARIIGPGKDPKSAEAEEGMVALQSLYDGWRTGGMFGRLEDVFLEASEPAFEGMRYFVPTGLTLTAATSVYIDANDQTRQPRDLAMYEVVTQGGDHTVRLYDRKEWVDLLDLESSDEAPLSGRGAYGLAACLATSEAFAAMFNDAQLSPRVERLAAQFTRGLMSKQGSTQDRSAGTYF
jgi:hypothetical protein